MTFLPLGHVKVEHNYTGTSWKDFTGHLSSAQINLREFSGLSTFAFSFYYAAMDPSQSSGTHVIKKGDKVRVKVSSGGYHRKVGVFVVKKVDVSIDLSQPVGRQNKVTVQAHGKGVAGVAGSGQSSGVGSHRELSNVISGAPFEIDSDGPNVQTTAWTGTAHASTSTATDINGVVRTNLCPNPSFETNLTSWGTNDATMSRDSTWSDTGSSSVKVVATGASSDSFVFYSQAFTAGHTYTISATIRLADTIASTPSSHALRISIFDATFAHNYESNQPDNEEGVTKVSITFTAALTNSHQIRLYVGSNTAGATAWWDSVLVEETATAKPYFDGGGANDLDTLTGNTGLTTANNGVLRRTNLVTNPSFETNTTGWTSSFGSIARSTAQFAVGTASLAHTSNGGGAANVFSPLATAVPSATYVAQVRIRTTVNRTVNLNIRYNTAAAPSTFTFSGSPTSVALTANTWTTVTFIGTVGASAFQVGVFASVLGPSNTEVNYFDAVILEKASVVLPYFDGATTSTDADTYAWTGTAHASSSTDTEKFTEVASINDATEFDQILLTRDSNTEVMGFEDPDGTLQIYDASTRRTGSPTLSIGANKYSAIDQTFDMSHIVNVVMFKYVEKIRVDKKHTRKVEHDVTFTDSASLAKYGPHKKVITTHKKSNFSAQATAIFAKNADPQEVPRSVTVPMRTASDLLPGYSDGFHVGLKVNIVLPDGTTTYTCRVAKIVHNLTPTSWTVQIFLRAQNLTQRHVHHKDAVNSEIGNNQDGAVLSAHIEDNIDGTGKTVTNATVQTKSSGNRILVRDDGSEGIIEFWSGQASETKGRINPGVDGSGTPYIDFRTSTVSPALPARIYMHGSGTLDVQEVELLGGTSLHVTGNTDIDGNLTVNSPSTLSSVLCGALTPSGQFHALNGIWDDLLSTTVNATNANLNASTGRLARSTSLRAHKTLIEPLEPNDDLLDVEPVTYYSRADYEANGESTEGLYRIPGVIAEDVEEKAPLFAQYDADGALVGVSYDRIGVALLGIVRKQQEQIATLTERLGALERAALEDR